MNEFKHFSITEFYCQCKDCKKQTAPPDEVKKNLTNLINEVLDPLRIQLGEPIVINSGYRCYKHKLQSINHLGGYAADIRVGRQSRTEIEEVRLATMKLCREKNLKAYIGEYETHVHVDLHPRRDMLISAKSRL